MMKINDEVKISFNNSNSLKEKDLHDYLEKYPNEIGVGTSRVIGREYVVGGGRIDLVVENLSDEIWAVELKIGEAGRDAIGQIAHYVSALGEEFEDRNVFGLLIARSFDLSSIQAYKSLRNIGLKTYQINFSTKWFQNPILESPVKIGENNQVQSKIIVHYTSRRCINCLRDNKYEVGSVYKKCCYCGYEFGVF